MIIAVAALALACAFMFINVFMRDQGPVTTPVVQSAGAAASQTHNDAYSNVSLRAKSVIVLDITSGKTLFERSPDAQLPLASITKVPLAIAVSEVLSPDAAIKITRDTAPLGSAERLAAGEVWRIKDILDFTLVASSNAGAEILAESASPAIRAKYPDAPPVDATLWRMNDLAKDLGLKSMYFINVSGLDESATQAGAYGSARDVATLFAYAAHQWPLVFAGTTKNDLLLTSVRGGSTSAFNTDQALGDIPGLIMGKTGFTDLAGGNLAIVFDVGPARPVVAVVLGSTYTERFDDMRKLVAATFSAVSNQNEPTAIEP